jgi:hypothetical protein
MIDISYYTKNIIIDIRYNSTIKYFIAKVMLVEKDRLTMVRISPGGMTSLLVQGMSSQWIN